MNLGGINNTLSVTNSTVWITGVVQDLAANSAKALTKTGAGTLTLTGANTYSAVTNILAGTVNLQNAGALGAIPSTAALSGGATLVASGATLQVQGGITVAEPIVLAGGTIESVTGANTISGAVTLNASSTIQVDVNTLTVSGVITGAADLSKTSGGTLILAGANSYTGQTNINTGIVQLTNATGARRGHRLGHRRQLRDVAGQPRRRDHVPRQAACAQWHRHGSDVVRASSWAPAASQSAISGNVANTWTGNIVLNSLDATISSFQNTFTISGAISGSGALTKVGAGLLAIASEAHTSAVSVSAGTLSVSGVGQLFTTNGATVYPNATLTLDNTGTNLTNRFQDSSGAADLTLNNGTFNFLGNNTAFAATSDALGTVKISAGSSFFNQTSGSGLGASASLTIGTLTRTAGATVSFVPGGLAGINSSFNTSANRIFVNALGAGAAMINGIFPWATIGTLGGLSNQLDFMTLVSATGGNNIAAFSNYKTSIASAGPTDIVRLQANETLTANKVVGAISSQAPPPAPASPSRRTTLPSRPAPSCPRGTTR